MLAQNFKTPAELSITDAEFDALHQVLRMLERGELKHRAPDNGPYFQDHFGFNMGDYYSTKECGTVACIGGWVALLTGRDPHHYVCRPTTGDLYDLFWANGAKQLLSSISTDQAAIALRNYLTHGEPRWDEALASA